MKLKLLVFAAVLLLAGAFVFAQRRPDTEKPITGDFKITIRNTIAGQSNESTTMIKGARERDETNMAAGGMNIGQVNITQCDLKRTIQINDRARKYFISPMDSGDSSIGVDSGAPTSGGPSRRGGVVTMTINTVDTGERRQMFGFNARHLKSAMMYESSADACQQQHMKMERDGWYINLEYGLNCGIERPPQMGRMAPAGCRDRYQFKRTGPANLGFPLIETTTMYGADGSVQYSSSREVIELSRQNLDAALFDVPAGYTEARSQQEMYAAPSMAEIMAMSGQQQGQSTGDTGPRNSTSGMPANAARVRVGVMSFNNKTRTSVSTDSLREQLIAQLNGDGIDAIALNASSPSEAAMEAKAKQCAYILFTDISTLKSASAGKKLGGLLGRATGVDSGNSGKSEARLEFRLVATGSTSPTMQSSASGTEDNQDASVRVAIEGEAKAVAAAVPKM